MQRHLGNFMNLGFGVAMLLSGCGDEDNQAPVAEAGQPASVKVNTGLTLDGTKSTDEDGDELTYKWTLKNKPTGATATLTKDTDAKPVFKANKEGAYLFALIVNDGDLDSDPDEVKITVTQDTVANRKPVANAGGDASVKVNTETTLDGGKSSDTDGDKVTYKWSVKTKPEGATATLTKDTDAKPVFKANKEGAYLLQLVVNDGHLDSDPDEVKITVTQ